LCVIQTKTKKLFVLHFSLVFCLCRPF
jgi:hypothetical protein